MSIDTVVVRHVRAEELDALLELYAQMESGESPMPAAGRLDDFWRDALANPLLHYLGAEVDGRLAASCILVIVPNLIHGTRPYALIENVVTDQAHRRRGLGTAVLRQALRIAWDADCYKVMLLTGREEPGIHAFYENVGFAKGSKTAFTADAPDRG